MGLIAHAASTGRGSDLPRTLPPWLTPYLLILPGFVFVLAFTIYPLVAVVGLSLGVGGTTTGAPGLTAYWSILADPLFGRVARNTALYVLLVVPPSVCLGLCFALLVNRRGLAASFLRTAFAYPIVLPLVSVGTIWLFLMTPEYGLLARAAAMTGARAPNLLGEPGTVLPALAAVGVWRQSGFYAIFFLAGLQGVDREVENAARIDGAGPVRLAWHIRLPLIRPTVVFVLTLAILNALQTFDLVYVMTQGGPDNASNLLLFDIFQTQFSFFDTRQAAALSTFLLVAVGCVSAFQVFVTDRMGRDGRG